MSYAAIDLADSQLGWRIFYVVILGLLRRRMVWFLCTSVGMQTGSQGWWGRCQALCRERRRCDEAEKATECVRPVGGEQMMGVNNKEEKRDEGREGRRKGTRRGEEGRPSKRKRKRERAPLTEKQNGRKAEGEGGRGRFDKRSRRGRSALLAGWLAWRQGVVICSVRWMDGDPGQERGRKTAGARRRARTSKEQKTKGARDRQPGKSEGHGGRSEPLRPL